MSVDAERWIGSWMKEFSLKDFKTPLSLYNQDAIKDAAKILNEIISFCKERSIRLCLLIPPVYHTLGEKFTPEIRKKIIDSLTEKIDDKSLWFHNYMDDKVFSNDITLFQNSFFLNRKGAMLFTKQVLKDLEIIE